MNTHEKITCFLLKSNLSCVKIIYFPIKSKMPYAMISCKSNFTYSNASVLFIHNIPKKRDNNLQSQKSMEA